MCPMCSGIPMCPNVTMCPRFPMCPNLTQSLTRHALKKSVIKRLPSVTDVPIDAIDAIYT